MNVILVKDIGDKSYVHGVILSITTTKQNVQDAIDEAKGSTKDPDISFDFVARNLPSDCICIDGDIEEVMF